MDKIYHFSAPGRTEIGGNHTDHQHGCVIAAAVDMDDDGGGDAQRHERHPRRFRGLQAG